jgi:hypothetical protein
LLQESLLEWCKGDYSGIAANTCGSPLAHPPEEFPQAAVADIDPEMRALKVNMADRQAKSGKFRACKKGSEGGPHVL